MSARWVASGVAVLAAVLFAVALAGSLSASGANHAGLVITFPDHTETFWVDFSEDEISGRDLLERSGLDVTFSGFGGLGSGVCAIGDVGCFNPGDCFCQCKSGTCNYWVYFRLVDGEWKQSPLGASARKLKNGDVDGWVWGSGDPPDQLLTPIPCPTPTSPPPTQAPTNPPATQPPAAGGNTDAPAASSGAVSPSAAPDSRAPTPRATNTTKPPTGSPRTPTPSDFDDNAERDSESADFPWSLVAFGAVSVTMLAAVGVVVIRRRPHG